MDQQTASRWLIGTAVLGFVTWLIAWGMRLNGADLLEEIELLLYFGVAVTTPLAMRLALRTDRNGRIAGSYSLAIRFHPVAIAATGGAVWLESKVFATALATVWLIQTLLLGWYGLQQMLSRPTFSIEEVCIDAGLIYVPISAVWLIAYTADYPLLTFSPVIILLTAVHFTFISPGALVLAGMSGRRLIQTRAWRFYVVIASGVVISPLFVAVGITITQIAEILLIEAFAVITLAGSFLMLAALLIVGGLPEQRIPRILLITSLSTLAITMMLALAYSLGRLTGQWSVYLDQMVQWHGWLNAVGFTLLGLLAWSMITPKSHSTLMGMPYSRLPWRWHIGPDFLQRINAIDDNASPMGIVDNLSDYDRADFSTDAIADAVVRFYEKTALFDLLVYPEWQPGFRFLARVYKRLSSKIGQMNFPSRPETAETRISSDILPLKDEMDGRQQVRGWVRTYTETGQAVYVAAYSSHSYAGCRYMNIAFPLPFGNLTSILHLTLPSEQDGGLFLSSYSQRGQDQGVYFVNRLLTIRLPINETIRVYPPGKGYKSYPQDFPSGEILAEHRMWLFGLHFLTLHYGITRSDH